MGEQEFNQEVNDAKTNPANAMFSSFKENRMGEITAFLDKLGEKHFSGQTRTIGRDAITVKGTPEQEAALREQFADPNYGKAQTTNMHTDDAATAAEQAEHAAAVAKMTSELQAEWGSNYSANEALASDGLASLEAQLGGGTKGKAAAEAVLEAFLVSGGSYTAAKRMLFALGKTAKG